MALQQGLAISTPSRIALSAWVRLAAGLGLCVLIAAVAIVAGDFAPIVGAPVFAIAIGVVITNTLRGPLQIGSLRVGEVSKLCLKGGIILLGASLDLGVILRTGAESLPVLLITIATGLACALLLGWTMDVHWRMRCLIGIGTTICGASAIAALAPVVRAKAEEIAYSISVIFFFNMLAVFTFPAIGHLLSLSDPGFGLWAGTAVNDTSAVVAAGFAYSHDAGTIAIILFVVASLLNTLGLMGHYAPTVQLAGRWVMVVALAAVGLQGHWRAFAGAGTRPLLLGLATWVAVGATSLAIQMWTNSL